MQPNSQNKIFKALPFATLYVYGFLMDYLLLTLSVFTGSSKSLITKYVKNGAKGMSKTMTVNIISFFFGVLALLFFALPSMLNVGFSVPVPLALLYAVCTFGSQFALIQAVEYGSVAISSLFYSCGFVIPTVWGAVRYNENINALYIVGFVIILISFCLSVDKVKGEKFNIKWLIFALMGTVFSGLIGVTQKLFTNEYGEYSLDQFLFLSFIFIVILSVIFLLLSLLYKKKKQDEFNVAKEIKIDKRIIVFSIILGLILGGHNKLCTYLSGVLESFIMFPVCNGGVIFLTAVLSSLIYKEKLSKRQVVAVVLGVVAIGIIAVGKAI